MSSQLPFNPYGDNTANKYLTGAMTYTPSIDETAYALARNQESKSKKTDKAQTKHDAKADKADKADDASIFSTSSFGSIARLIKK